MDGKHVLIKPPLNIGSYSFNYKHTFSIILLDIVDADYKFVFVDGGCNGRISDDGVFKILICTKKSKRSTLTSQAKKIYLMLSNPFPMC